MFGFHVLMKTIRMLFGGLSTVAGLLSGASAGSIPLSSIVPWLQDPTSTHSTFIFAGMTFEGRRLFFPFGVSLVLSLFCFGLARWLFQGGVRDRTKLLQ